MSAGALPISIRSERSGDRERVFTIHERAFGRPGEARLVDALRGRALPQISLVAETNAAGVVGHVFFSPVEVIGGLEHRSAIALGPVAVDPARQGLGVGSELCRRGLDACRALEEPVVFVLGHAAYYPRFGFEAARPRGFFYKSAEFDPAFFVAELVPGALPGYAGEVVYRPEFDEV
jgi:putative acetyltransferase